MPRIPSPWGAFLEDIDNALTEPGTLHCFGGFVVAVHKLLDENPSPTSLEIKEALAGNLCRCTGYGRIEAAVERVIEARHGQ